MGVGLGDKLRTKVLILQHHGDHKEMPSDDNRMDTAFGSLNVIANLFQTGE